MIQGYHDDAVAHATYLWNTTPYIDRAFEIDTQKNGSPDVGQSLKFIKVTQPYSLVWKMWKINHTRISCLCV